MPSTVFSFDKHLPIFVFTCLLAGGLLFSNPVLGSEICKSTFSHLQHTTRVESVEFQDFPWDAQLDMASIPEGDTAVTRVKDSPGRFLVTDDLLSCVGIVIKDRQNNVALMSHFVTRRAKYNTPEGLAEYVAFLRSTLATSEGKMDGASIYLVSGIETTQHELNTTKHLIAELSKHRPERISWYKNLETYSDNHAFVFDLQTDTPYVHNRGSSGPLLKLSRNP